ncbi:MAG: DNA-binding protein [Eubacterium sp.]|jgi:hypothetical protein|nr:DNA-binding protein [Eubacterium sp.]
MSRKDGKDYLYLIWKSGQSGRQYIVGQLTKNSHYEFRYCHEVKTAIDDGFVPLLCFPDLNKQYEDEKLFSVFSSRLPDKKRKNINDILKKYELEDYDEYALLKRSGARLPIDNLEFIDPILEGEKDLTRNFFVAGARHYLNCEGGDCVKAIEITRGDEVYLKKDSENKYDINAVQVLDGSGKILGYVPRYYSNSVAELLETKKNISCHVYNVDKSKNCNECIKVIMKIRN